jgi:hypothetical protein
MIGRRSAALLCVLLAHALAVYLLLRLGPDRERHGSELETAPITLFLEPVPAEVAVPPARTVATAPVISHPREAAAPAPAAAADSAESGAITLPGHVDWPIEGKKSAAKVLAAEAEAARIARLFSGPEGTWASLTPREKSRLKKFQWKPGVDGLEYDERGNAIYHISDGCVVVNLLFIGCTLGKATVHGDLFKDMRLYFDERRLPPLDTGNGSQK